LLWPEPLEPGKDAHAESSCGKAATCPCDSLVGAVRELMSLAKSVMVGAVRGDELETAEGVVGAAAAGVVGAM